MFKVRGTKKYSFNRSAFSLIEIMAVILIVSLGLVGTVNLATQNIQAQTVNEDSLIAYQLAQEALELARQIRDTNWILGNDWRDDMAPGKYCVDYRNLSAVSITAINDCPLYLDANNFYYSPTIGAGAETTPHHFSRMLEVGTGTSSAQVMATVSWTSRNGGVQSYNVETVLYDWY